MATIATVQVLIDRDDDEEITNTLHELRSIASTVPGVRDMRMTDAQGKPLGGVSMHSALDEAIECVFSKPLLVLPANGAVLLDPREAGKFRVRAQREVEDDEGIEVAITVTAAGVKVALQPTGQSDASLDAEGRSMSFDEADGLRAVKHAVPFNLDLNELIDLATGKPLAGVAMLVPAVAQFKTAKQMPDGRWQFERLTLLEVFEQQAVPYGMTVGGTGRRIQMFYDCKMQLISHDRTAIQPKDARDGEGPVQTG